MKNQIDKFILDKINEVHQPIFSAFRSQIKNQFPFLKEEMRGGTEKYYGVPVYRNKRIIITVSPTQKGITFSFANGKLFKDKYGLLEGVGNKTLNLRVANIDDYKVDIMEYYIKQAIELDNRDGK